MSTTELMTANHAAGLAASAEYLANVLRDCKERAEREGRMKKEE